MSIFTIPSDYRIETLNKIIEYNKNHSLQIKEVYGSLNTSAYGSGRKSVLLPSVTKENFETYIRVCREKGIRFNYTLNTTCIGNKEFYTESKKELVEFLKYLVDMGVEDFTIAMPSLVNLMEKQFPKVRVTLSIITGIDSLQKMKYFCQFDVIKNVYLHEKTFRDFKLMKQLLACAKEHHKAVGVIANSICLAECPFRMYHYNFGSHVTYGQENPIELYGSLCAKEKMTDVRKILTAHWIRPEDLHRYLDLGIERFKLAGREIGSNTAEPLIEMCKIYDSGRYEGNLLSLFTGFADCSYTQVLDMRSTENMEIYLQNVFEGKYPCHTGACMDCGMCKPVVEEIRVCQSAKQKWIEKFEDRIQKQGEC